MKIEAILFAVVAIGFLIGVRSRYRAVSQLNDLKKLDIEFVKEIVFDQQSIIANRLNANMVQQGDSDIGVSKKVLRTLKDQEEKDSKRLEELTSEYELFVKFKENTDQENLSLLKDDSNRKQLNDLFDLVQKSIEDSDE